MKKSLLALACLGSMISMTAAAEEFTTDGYTYNTLTETTVEVTGATDRPRDVIVPATVSDGTREYTVVAVADQAFRMASLSSAVLPETITRIGTEAFYMNVQMKSCNLPEGLEEIGDNAFARSFSLKVDLPSTVKKIGTGAFSECGGIISVTLYKGVEVGENAFLYCEGVTECTLEGEPAEVGDNALGFNNLSVLNVNMPFPPLFNPKKAFSYGSNTDYTWTLKLSDVQLCVPAGAAESFRSDIHWSVFTNIREIEEDELRDFTAYGVKYRVLEDGTVEACGVDPEATSVILSTSVDYAGKDYVVSSIAPRAFGASAITDAVVSGFATIPAELFCDCEALASVTLGYGTEVISGDAFRNCTALEYIYLPESLKEIQQTAFINCFSLKEVELPADITVYPNAFMNCKLQTVRFAGAIAGIATGAFYSMDLRDVELNVTALPEFDPEYIFLRGSEGYNNEVVLYVPEAMVDIFYSSPEWDKFKRILPIGTAYDHDSEPYDPDKAVADLGTLKYSRGMRVLEAAEGKVQFLAASLNDIYLWDGNAGMRLTRHDKDKVSMNMWISDLQAGQYVNGTFKGFTSPEQYAFLTTSAEYTADGEVAPIAPVEVTGSQLVRNVLFADELIHAYVRLSGVINGGNFTSDDGQEFYLVDEFGYGRYGEEFGKDATIQGIFIGTDDPGQEGNSDNKIIIIRDEDIEVSGVSSIEADDSEAAIYTPQGVYVGTEAGALPAGLYISKGKKLIIK